jgi:hypothetical protein
VSALNNAPLCYLRNPTELLFDFGKRRFECSATVGVGCTLIENPFPLQFQSLSTPLLLSMLGCSVVLRVTPVLTDERPL